MLILLSLMFNFSYQITDCISISDPTLCYGDCAWNIWNPGKCQTDCSLLLNEINCSEAIDCQWSSEVCGNIACEEAEDEDRCQKIVACTWHNKCWDATCIELFAEKESDCPNDYCIWNKQRNLCYDKKCSDYSNFPSCSTLSFCLWEKYKCIDDKSKNKLEY